MQPRLAKSSCDSANLQSAIFNVSGNLPTVRIRENISLAPLTTLRIGGPARFFAEAASEAEVIDAIDFARQQSLPLFVLGGGSNLLVSDSGFSGLVLRIAIGGIQPQQDPAHVFEAGAGVPWDDLVAAAVAADCAGIECLSGIPGSVGGTPAQNVGAYGQEVAETIERVRVFDLLENQFCDLSNSQCGFHYRTSIFNSSAAGRYIIVRVRFLLHPGGQPVVSYADLKKFFAHRGGAPALAEVRRAVLEIRRSKGMLIVAGDADCRSAGSFFKNPVVSESAYEQLRARFVARGPEPPRFPAADGNTKLSAAWLVEHAGFHRGWQRGAVGISSKHALAIVNRGGATAAEVIALKNQIQEKVEAAFGIRLQPEPVFVGF